MYRYRNSIDLPPKVINSMCRHACGFLFDYSTIKVLILAIFSGAFITAGALFSILLASGTEAIGIQRLLEGFGFSAGFFFVIISQGVLFTEANVLIPISLLHCSRKKMVKSIIMFWLLAWFGNFIGAYLTGYLINFAQFYPSSTHKLLTEIINMKLHYSTVGTLHSWLQVIVSGMLANWLVGMAAFFAAMSKTIIGKYIPILLAVSLFVAGNFQHSPANMGYFSLLINAGYGPSWGTAFAWNIIPAGIGNMLGGTLFVALPFWYIFKR